VRVGQKQKKVDIDIPSVDDFIHKAYINVARKVYKNVYLFEINIMPLQIQKNHRELEIIVQECILNTLRESIPVEAILKAYMDETIEEDVVEEIKEQIIEEPIKQAILPSEKMLDTKSDIPTNTSHENMTSHLSFNDIDYVKTDDGTIANIIAPKSISRLEEISEIRSKQRKQDSDDDDENIKLTISDQSFNLDSLDVHTIGEPSIDLLPDLLIDEIEVLE
jgi:hypothetical protein